MADLDDPRRNLDLAALADRIHTLIQSEIDAYQGGEGEAPEFLLILIDSPDIETTGSVMDFEGFSEGFEDIVLSWIEDGLIDSDQSTPPAPKPN